jgi:hypothetical protein
VIDPYAVLGVSPRASADELTAAHRRLVRRHHPDLLPPAQRQEATRRVQEINVAYGLVRDPVTRREHDRLRRARLASSPAAADAELARQWDEAMRSAGRWAGSWWRRNRRSMRAGAARAAMRGKRAGLDVLGRVLWLGSCALWGVVGLATAVAAQRLLAVDGPLAVPTGTITGVLVGSQRGWQRRLRLAGLAPQPAARRIVLILAAAVLAAALLADAWL